MNCYACAAIRLLAYALLTLILIPVQVMAIAFRLRLADDLPRVYHALCLKILHIELRVSGVELMDGPGVIVANHASYQLAGFWNTCQVAAIHLCRTSSGSCTRTE